MKDTELEKVTRELPDSGDLLGSKRTELSEITRELAKTSELLASKEEELETAQSDKKALEAATKNT